MDALASWVNDCKIQSKSLCLSGTFSNLHNSFNGGSANFGGIMSSFTVGKYWYNMDNHLYKF